MPEPIPQLPKRLHRAAPYAVLAVCLLFSAVAAILLDAAVNSREQARFASRTRDLRESLQRRINTYAAFLVGGAAILEGRQDWDQPRFVQYVSALDLEQNYPGALGIGYTPTVMPSRVPRYETEVRKADPTFRVWPKRDDQGPRQPIQQIIPRDLVNERAIGFDLASESRRRAAMERARDTGRPSATMPVELVQGLRDDPMDGFLMFVPIFDGKSSPKTTDERRRRIRGFIYSPFSSATLLADHEDTLGSMDVEILAPNGRRLVGGEQVRSNSPRFKTVGTLTVGGLTWSLISSSTPAYEASAGTSLAPWALAGGVVISLLLFGLTFREAEARERVLSEAQKRWSAQERFRMLIDQSPQGILTLDPAGRVQRVNPAFVALYGREGENLRGRPLPLEPSFLPESLRQTFERGMKGETVWLPSHEVEAFGKDGEPMRRWVRSLMHPIRSAGGDLTEIAWIHEDVTSERLAQLAAAESEERFRTMGDAAPVMLWMADELGDVVWANLPYLEYTGLSVEESLADGWAETVDPLHRDRVLEIFFEAVERREPFEVEYRLRRHDGGYRWVVDRGVPRFDPSGRYLGFIGAVDDIQDRLEATEFLAKANIELEARVAERTAELRRSIADLESFSYTVAHDLRSPLRAMGGYARILVEDHAEALPEEARTHLERIRENSMRMAHLIDGLLDLARISRMQVTPRWVDVTAISQEIVARLRRRDPERRVTVSIQEGLAAYGDERLVPLVLQNLIENAWKFTGMRLDGRIEVGTERTDRGPAIFVRDNGAGYDPRHSAKLFGAFERLHSNAEFSGNGIGLATVKRIVERHQGQVWSEGAVDAGATFWFTLNGRKSGENGAEQRRSRTSLH